MPLPKTVASDLLDKIILLAEETDEFVPEGRLIFFEAQAKRQIQQAPQLAYTLLGMLACLKGDVKAMHHNHLTAIKNDTSDTWLVEQYCVSLNRVGLCGDAYALGKELYDKGDRTPHFVKTFAESALGVGNETEFKAYAELFKRLTGEFHPLVFREDDDEYLENMLRAMDRRIGENPGCVKDLDPNLLRRTERLIQGVQLD